LSFLPPSGEEKNVSIEERDIFWAQRRTRTERGGGEGVEWSSVFSVTVRGLLGEKRKEDIGLLDI